MVDEQQIAAWKAQYGELTEISVEAGPNDKAVCYLKPTDRDIMARGLSLVTRQQVLEAGEFVLDNCFVGGDERCKDRTGANQKIGVAAAYQTYMSVDMLASHAKKI